MSNPYRQPGSIADAPLPEFGSVKECPKCGAPSIMHHPIYVPGVHPLAGLQSVLGSSRPAGEHLVWTCACQYQWRTRCKS